MDLNITLSGLHIYPVKSMQGISLKHAACSWNGLKGDRKFAFIHTDTDSDFPWLTARQIPEMVLFRPVPDISRGRQGDQNFTIETPSGERLPLKSDRLKGELLKTYDRPARLVHIGRGTHDCMPVSIVTKNAIRSLEEETGQSVNPARFRPNIILDTNSGDHFPEKKWLDHLITFGDRPDSAVLHINYPAKRCSIVNLNPKSARKNPDILKSVVEKMDGCFSVYASVHKEGTFRVGDKVTVKKI